MKGRRGRPAGPQVPPLPPLLSQRRRCCLLWRYCLSSMTTAWQAMERFSPRLSTFSCVLALMFTTLRACSVGVGQERQGGGQRQARRARPQPRSPTTELHPLAAAQACMAPPAPTHLGCAPSIWHRLSRMASLWGDILGRCAAGTGAWHGAGHGHPRSRRLLPRRAAGSHGTAARASRKPAAQGQTTRTACMVRGCCQSAAALLPSPLPCHRPPPALLSAPPPPPLPTPHTHLRNDGAVNVANCVAPLLHEPHRLLQEDVAAGEVGGWRG